MQEFWITAVWAIILGYALGSIPFGIILTRLGGAGDLREIGSGNIGATNVLRTGRKGLAVATLLLDLLKGLAAVLIAEAIWPGTGASAGAAALVGHCFPVWLKFRGGKGVATFAGILFGISWPLGLVYACLWIGVLIITRISSLGGLAAAASAPIAAALMGPTAFVWTLLALALLVFWQHRENIARLLKGQEPRIGGKKG